MNGGGGSLPGAGLERAGGLEEQPEGPGGVAPQRGLDEAGVGGVAVTALPVSRRLSSWVNKTLSSLVAE